MNNFFGENGLLYRLVNKMVDLLILNLVYIVTSIPILTIGAANVALYDVTLKMCKNEDGYIVKQYLKSFKSNFEEATMIWLGFLVIFCLLGIDFIIIGNSEFEMKKMILTILIAAFILVMIPFSYIAPQIAFFENSVSNYVKNALIISMTRIVYTLPVVVLNFIPIALVFLGGSWLSVGSRVMVMFGWAGIAYLNSFIFHIVFKKYM